MRLPRGRCRGRGLGYWRLHLTTIFERLRQLGRACGAFLKLALRFLSTTLNSASKHCRC